jgi:hypothetical protein
MVKSKWQMACSTHLKFAVCHRLPFEMLRVEECGRDELGLTPQEQSLFDEAHEFADVDRTEEDALETVPLQVRGGPR